MAFAQNGFEIERIMRELKISQERIDQCPIEVSTLEQIYNDYIGRYDLLEQYRVEILNVLNERMTADIHSIRSRIKDPDHLIGKIIRGTRKNPDKYRILRADNYWKVITDLIGIRIIILDKREWKQVHRNLLDLFGNQPELYCQKDADIAENYDRYTGRIDMNATVPSCCYHAEMPTALVSPFEDVSLYNTDHIRLDASKGNYRSVHYNIRYKKVYFEIQVRTLFEEGWLEFDHRMKYPKDQFNDRKKEYVKALGQLAEEADQMISNYREEDYS